MIRRPPRSTRVRSSAASDVYKRQGMIGCLGGFVLAWGQNSVQPDNFNADLTFIVYTMLILGGAARVIGPIFGAVVFWSFLSLIGGILTNLTHGDDPFIPSWIMSQN